MGALGAPTGDDSTVSTSLQTHQITQVSCVLFTVPPDTQRRPCLSKVEAGSRVGAPFLHTTLHTVDASGHPVPFLTWQTPLSESLLRVATWRRGSRSGLHR